MARELDVAEALLSRALAPDPTSGWAWGRSSRQRSLLMPQAAVSNRSTRALFDHLVGERQKFWRKLDTERLRGLQIDDELEPGWLLHGQLGGMRAFEHLAHQHPGLAIDLGNAGAVAQQPPFRGELA